MTRRIWLSGMLAMATMGGLATAGPARADDWSKTYPISKRADLHVTTDYRDVLAEIVTRRLKNPHLDTVFPEYTPRYHDIFRTT